MASSGRPSLDQRLRSNLGKLVDFGLGKNRQYRQNGNEELAGVFEAKLTIAKLVIPITSFPMLIEKIIEHTYAYWDPIFERDENIVWQVSQEFPAIKLHIEKIYNHRLDNGQLLVTDVDKAKTWVIVHGLVRMCIKGVIIIRAQNPAFCNYIDLTAAQRKWGVMDVQ